MEVIQIYLVMKQKKMHALYWTLVLQCFLVSLQRVLVTLNRHSEALVVAERACTRAFIDLLMERQAGSDGFYGNHVTDPPPITTDQITSIVQKQRSMVLYFSIASGFLYSWLLTPRDGEFTETNMQGLKCFK